jgi:hypothetical protein
LNTGDSGGKKGGKVRAANAKVDLTAMVDLAFFINHFLHAYYYTCLNPIDEFGLPDKMKMIRTLISKLMKIEQQLYCWIN